MRYEGFFVDTVREDVVEWARSAERLLGMDLDDWREAEPRPELPAALRWGEAPERAEGRRERLAFHTYIVMATKIEHVADKRRHCIGWPEGNSLAAIRGSQGLLEHGLTTTAETAFEGRGIRGEGRDGAPVVARFVRGLGAETELLELVAELREIEARGAAGTKARGYLLARWVWRDAWEAARRLRGVETRIHRPVFRFLYPGAVS